MMMRAWKMLCERNAVHLADIKNFPFFAPDDAPDPEKAKHALNRICERMDKLAALDELVQARGYNEQREAIDDDVFNYFDLSGEERALVLETVGVFLPSIRPRSYASLNTVAQHAAGRDDITRYARALGRSLTDWRKRTGGKGQFAVAVVLSDPRAAGTVGIVRITYDATNTTTAKVDTSVDDQLALSTLSLVRKSGLSVIPAGGALDLVPDAHIWIGDAFYLVRPLTRRSWTLRQALHDSEKIVRDVQSNLRNNRRPEVA
jgi:hypothetical protein